MSLLLRPQAGPQLTGLLLGRRPGLLQDQQLLLPFVLGPLKTERCPRLGTGASRRELPAAPSPGQRPPRVLAAECPKGRPPWGCLGPLGHTGSGGPAGSAPLRTPDPPPALLPAPATLPGPRVRPQPGPSDAPRRGVQSRPRRPSHGGPPRALDQAPPLPCSPAPGTCVACAMGTHRGA